MLQAISDLTANIAALKTQVSALVTAADADKAANAALTQQVAQLTTQVQTLQAQVSGGALAADETAALAAANTDLQTLTQTAADAAAKDAPAN